MIQQSFGPYIEFEGVSLRRSVTFDLYYSRTSGIRACRASRQDGFDSYISSCSRPLSYSTSRYDHVDANHNPLTLDCVPNFRIIVNFLHFKTKKNSNSISHLSPQFKLWKCLPQFLDTHFFYNKKVLHFCVVIFSLKLG